MPFKTYLLFMAVGSILAWVSWSFVLFGIDPFEAGWLGHGFFYLTLFLALMGTLATLGVVFRLTRMKQRSVLGREVRISFRHAVLLSLLAMIFLFLSANTLLFWWNFLAILLFAAALEYLFLLIHESRRS